MSVIALLPPLVRPAPWLWTPDYLAPPSTGLFENSRFVMLPFWEHGGDLIQGMQGVRATPVNFASGVPWDFSEIGPSPSFNGALSQYLDVTHSPQLLTNFGAYFAVILFRTTNTASDQCIWSTGSGNAANVVYQLVLNLSGVPGLTFRGINGAGNTSSCAVDGQFDDGRWHVAVMQQMFRTSRRLTVDNLPTTDSTSVDINITTSRTTLGAWNQGSNGIAMPFTGQIGFYALFSDANEARGNVSAYELATDPFALIRPDTRVRGPSFNRDRTLVAGADLTTWHSPGAVLVVGDVTLIATPSTETAVSPNATLTTGSVALTAQTSASAWASPGALAAGGAVTIAAGTSASGWRSPPAVLQFRLPPERLPVRVRWRSGSRYRGFRTETTRDE